LVSGHAPSPTQPASCEQLLRHNTKIARQAGSASKEKQGTNRSIKRSLTTHLRYDELLVPLTSYRQPLIGYNDLHSKNDINYFIFLVKLFSLRRGKGGSLDHQGNHLTTVH
jgi:hypothetical protein